MQDCGPRNLVEEQRKAAAVVDLVKVYGSGETVVRALDGLTVSFERATFTAIIGPSGAGKSTLMRCLAAVDPPTSGKVLLGDTDLTSLPDAALTTVRQERIGYVSQSFNLLPRLAAALNITLPIEGAGERPDDGRFVDLIGMLGLRDRLALARAIVARPDVILADEPTGNLDSRSGAEVLSLLRASVREMGQTIVMVAHDPGAAAYADRVVLLADGRVAGQLESPDVDSVSAALHHLAANR
jgi:putative ABC transport system ATP-binding protein